MMDNNSTTIKEDSGVTPKSVGVQEIPIMVGTSEFRQETDPKFQNVVITSIENGNVTDETNGATCSMVQVDEPYPETVINSWDDVSAKKNLIAWATDDSGSVSKKSLMKWFLDVDGGPAQDISAYRYPVGVVDKETGEPRYCPVAMDDSWTLADGSKTGIANRSILKKIVFLKNREGFPLNASQDDFVQRHMGDSSATSILSSNESPGEVILNETYDGMRYNAASKSLGVLDETPDYIDVSVVPMREGVFSGTDGIPTLKLYDQFKNDAHWLEGQPILHGHTGPTEIVTYRHNKLGKLLNVKVRPETKDVTATARYYKNKLSPERLAQIKSGTPYDGSIAYTTNTVPSEGDWTDANGTKVHYNAVEKDGYHFYHFAEVGEGACSVANGCGFLLNESNNINLNYRCKKNTEGTGYSCPDKADKIIPLKKYDGVERAGAVIKKSDGSFAAVGFDKATGKIQVWNATGERNAHAMASTYSAQGEQGMHTQADEYHPVKENETYSTIYNEFNNFIMSLNGNFWEPAVNAYLEKLNADLIMAKGNDSEIKKINTEIAKWQKLQDRLNGKQNSTSELLNDTSVGTVNDSEIIGTDILVNSGPLEAVSKLDNNVKVKINSEQIMTDEKIDEQTDMKVNAKGMIKDDEGTECFPFEMKDGVCKKVADKAIDETKANSVQVEVTIPEEFTQKMNEAISENESLKSALEMQTQKLNETAKIVEELLQKQNAAEEAQRSSMEKRDFETFSMQLNQANRTPEKVKAHYEGFKQNGWAYFADHPKILNTGLGTQMKAMGVSSSEGISELTAAKNVLSNTLRRRKTA